jgi:hypothetical protein
VKSCIDASMHRAQAMGEARDAREAAEGSAFTPVIRGAFAGSEA